MSVQSDDQPPTPETDGQPQAQPEPEAPAAADELETLRAELAEIEQKADEYLRLAQRTQADFINYRRRMDEERAQQARDAELSVCPAPAADPGRLRARHVECVRGRARIGLGPGHPARRAQPARAAGCRRRPAIEAEGAEFDPRVHEALGSAPSAQVAEGHVLHVVRQGYRKGDRVLRPTQVMVAKRPT